MNIFKQMRNSKGLTQEELSAKTGLVRSTISKWETGVVLPRPETLLLLAQIFECSVDELLKKSKASPKLPKKRR